MRPNDKEIEQQAFKWDHSIQDRVDFELGAKWARDFDPWHYVEDGVLPEIGQQIIFVTCELYNYTGKIIYNHKFDFYAFQQNQGFVRKNINEVKCWMYIPTPKQ